MTTTQTEARGLLVLPAAHLGEMMERALQAEARGAIEIPAPE
jgi:hypothetical protein